MPAEYAQAQQVDLGAGHGSGNQKEASLCPTACYKWPTQALWHCERCEVGCIWLLHADCLRLLRMAC